jgi:hypothetical protein
LSVIGHLFGDPGWYPDPKKYDVLEFQLKRLCEIASPSQPFCGMTPAGFVGGHDVRSYWSFSLERFRGNYIVPADPSLAKIFRKPRLNEHKLADNLITVVFKRTERDFGRRSDHSVKESSMFEWRCQPAHFDFVKRGIANPDKISLENLPSIPDIRTLCELVYSQNLMTFDGRILAIKMIFTYLKLTNNLDMTSRASDEARELKQLLNRWIDTTGEFFAHWKDGQTTHKVYNVVSDYWSTDELCSRKLVAFFPWLLKTRIKARDVVDIEKILTSDFAIREKELKAEQTKDDGNVVTSGLLNYLDGQENTMLPGSPDSKSEIRHLLRLAGAEDYLRGFTKCVLNDLFREHDPDTLTYNY